MLTYLFEFLLNKCYTSLFIPKNSFASCGIGVYRVIVTDGNNINILLV